MARWHSASEPDLRLQGEAFQEFYASHSPGLDTCPVAYRLIITVKNVGTGPLTYDEIHAAFLPGRGKPLGMTTRHTKDDRPVAMTLQAGAEAVHEFTTDGYTLKLLRDAGDSSLRFAMGFVKCGSSVGGRFFATLPGVDDLPQYETTGRRGGHPLQFTAEA